MSNGSRKTRDVLKYNTMQEIELTRGIAVRENDTSCREYDTR